jgi:hypothetical protein
LFDLAKCIVVVIVVSAGVARCILERPAEEQFFRSLCSLSRPVGEKQSAARYNYTWIAATFTTPKYIATAGDALSR